MRTQLASPFHDEVFASDATLVKGSLVKAPLTPEEITWLWRRAPQRAGAVSLEFPGRLCALEGQRSPTVDFALQEWVQRRQFTTVCNYTFKRIRHVNIQESLLIRTLGKLLSRGKQFHNKRVFLLLDSQVAQGAGLRGRASSHLLNRVFVSLMPVLLACNIKLYVFWIQSLTNPGDDGTRDKPLRRALPMLDTVVKAVKLGAESCPRIFSIHKELYGGREKVFIHYFAGENDVLGEEFRKFGWIVIAYDILRNPAHDITDKKFLNFLIEEIRRLRPQASFLGPPCSSFSSWLYMQPWFSRTESKPWGDNEHPKERQGNTLLRATLVLID